MALSLCNYNVRPVFIIFQVWPFRCVDGMDKVRSCPYLYNEQFLPKAFERQIAHDACRCRLAPAISAALDSTPLVWMSLSLAGVTAVAISRYDQHARSIKFAHLYLQLLEIHVILSEIFSSAQQDRDAAADAGSHCRRSNYCAHHAFALEFAWSILQRLPHLGEICYPHIILPTSHRLHVLFHGAVCVIPKTFNHPGGRDIFEKCAVSAALLSWKPSVAS